MGREFPGSSVLMGDFSDGSDSKESAGNAGDPDSVPGSGRSPGERHGNPLQYSCLKNPMDKRAGWATVHGLQRIGHCWATNTFTFTLQGYGFHAFSAEGTGSISSQGTKILQASQPHTRTHTTSQKTNKKERKRTMGMCQGNKEASVMGCHLPNQGQFEHQKILMDCNPLNTIGKLRSMVI